MKIVNNPVPAVVLAAIGLLAAGCSNEPSPGGSAAAPASTPPAPTSPAAPAAEPEGPEAALAALEQAYRDLTGLTDRVEVEYRTGRSDNKVDYLVRFGADDTVYLDLPDSDIVIAGDRFFMTMDANATKYLEVGTAETPYHSFLATTGSRVAPLQLAMRYAGDPAAMLKSLTSMQLVNPQVVSADAGGFDIEGENGSTRVDVDPVTGLIAAVVVDFVPPNREGEQWQFKTTMTSTVDPGAPALAFSPGERFRVLSAAALTQASAGEPAPDFTLEALDGEQVSLSSLRGSVVVLDFWATWCGPCRRGLPNLEEFHRWAESSGMPIRVFAVDVWERHPTEQAKRAAVEKYWRDNGFTMTTLLDLNGAAASPFGFRSIPTMIVIDPEGKIAKVHTGYDPGVVDKLKAEAQLLLADA